MPHSRLILNRDLVGSDVPGYHVLELEPPGEGRPYAWSRIWEFALTFDPEAYSLATGKPLNGQALAKQMSASLPIVDRLTGQLADLRAALHWMYWEGGQGSTLPLGNVLVEAVLDAIYARVSGGKKRPLCDPGPYEPGIGTFAGSVPGTGGQHRFWFTSRHKSSRDQLYDMVAGMLLREMDSRVYLSALYLDPPTYGLDGGQDPGHTFSLLLQRRRSGSNRLLREQYEQLTRLVVNVLADRGKEHYPS